MYSNLLFQSISNPTVFNTETERSLDIFKDDIKRIPKSAGTEGARAW
jgi:hypothetical protein